MADWQAFAENFLNRTAEGIKERTADAKSYEERQRELGELYGMIDQQQNEIDTLKTQLRHQARKE